MVANRLGHKSTARFERVYGDLGDHNYRDAVEKLPTPELAWDGVSKMGNPGVVPATDDTHDQPKEQPQRS